MNKEQQNVTEYTYESVLKRAAQMWNDHIRLHGVGTHRSLPPEAHARLAGVESRVQELESPTPYARAHAWAVQMALQERGKPEAERFKYVVREHGGRIIGETWSRRHIEMKIEPDRMQDFT